MNRDERLRELIHGGPYDLRRWAVMVRLAANADDDGVVSAPELAVVSDWISSSEKWSLNVLRHLKKDGWITLRDDNRWDLSVNLRQVPAPVRGITDRAPY